MVWGLRGARLLTKFLMKFSEYIQFYFHPVAGLAVRDATAILAPHTQTSSHFEWLDFCFEAFDSQRQIQPHFLILFISDWSSNIINLGLLFQVECLRSKMNEDLRNEMWKTTRWHKQTPATTRFTLKTKLHPLFNNKTPFMHRCGKGRSLGKITLSCSDFSLRELGRIVNA